MVARRSNVLISLSLLVALMLSACGGGGGGASAPPFELQSISIGPAASIPLAATRAFSVTGTSTDGRTAIISSGVTWTSSDTSVATVSAAGVALAHEAGTTTIGASVSGFNASATLTVTAPSSGHLTLWKFDDPAARLAPFAGAGTLAYRDPAGSGWGPATTQFKKASALGIPLMDGQDVDVMAFPATTPSQGYVLTHNASPNGVFKDAGLVSNYTIVMDLLWPSDDPAYWHSLYQTDLSNGSDGDMFFKDLDDGSGKIGFGIENVYNTYGAIAPGTWHRVVFAVQCAVGEGGTGQIHRYIDGVFVGGNNTSASAQTDCRWNLGPSFFLFTDENDETSPGYLASLMFVDRFMYPAEVAALGGPNAAGASVPGAAPVLPAHASKRVMIFGHRTQSGSAPENTLVGIDQAFSLGADAIECDVNYTSDGAMILMHDATVDRTTDGTGTVQSMTLAQIQALDAGSWFDLEFANTRVPTLVQALGAASGKGKLLLDVKPNDAAADIKQAMTDAGVADDAVYLSHQGDDPAVLADFQTHLPNTPILAGLFPPDNTTASFDALKAKGVVGFDVDYKDPAFTANFIAAAKANGMIVVAFTVLDPDTMLRLIDMGVDGMETDFPGVLDELMP